MSSEIGEIKIFRVLKKYLTNNIKLLKILINDYKDGKKNIFHIAANNDKIISLLFFYSFYYNNNIQASVLDIKNKSSHTPLHIACRNGFYNCVQYLINLGANINSVDKDNKTALFYAVQSNNFHIIKYLIINGVNKYITDKNGNKAIYYAYDRSILDILEDKSWFAVVCKCKTQYENIKNHHRNIAMVILLIILMLFHGYIVLKYEFTDFITNCKYDIGLNFDYTFLIINITFEFLGLFLYIFFQIIKTKKENNNNNKYINHFCIKENGIEFYELFKYNENLCTICRRVKESNTKHCIACNVCIDGFDHHCFFLNACISRKNSKYFYIFVVEILLTVIFNFTISIKFLIDLFKEPKIYYGLFINDCNFNKNENKFFDYIIFAVDIIYCLFCIFTILISAIPIIVYLIRTKLRNNKLNLKKKANSPLLSIDEIS